PRAAAELDQVGPDDPDRVPAYGADLDRGAGFEVTDIAGVPGCELASIPGRRACSQDLYEIANFWSGAIIRDIAPPLPLAPSRSRSRADRRAHERLQHRHPLGLDVGARQHEPAERLAVEHGDDGVQEHREVIPQRLRELRHELSAQRLDAAVVGSSSG